MGRRIEGLILEFVWLWLVVIGLHRLLELEVFKLGQLSFLPTEALVQLVIQDLGGYVSAVVLLSLQKHVSFLFGIVEPLFENVDLLMLDVKLPQLQNRVPHLIAHIN